MSKIELDDQDVKLIYFLSDIALKNHGLQILSGVNKLLEKLPSPSEEVKENEPK
jgi:hypothetical protein